MKNKFILLVVFSFVTAKLEASQRVRWVTVKTDQIVTVKTSLGIATIIQVPDRPNSVVVGDQNSFKVEYLDQAITIKPLTSGVKSNLYIYTDWRRFNVELVSGSELQADYVVYLDIPRRKLEGSTASKNSKVQWTDLKNRLRQEELTLEIKKGGRNRDGITMIEFLITSEKKGKFSPEWIWITQGKEVLPIHKLFLSSLVVTPQEPIFGMLQLRDLDVNLKKTMRLELRRKSVSYLTIDKVSSWHLK